MDRTITRNLTLTPCPWATGTSFLRGRGSDRAGLGKEETNLEENYYCQKMFRL